VDAHYDHRAVAHLHILPLVLLQLHQIYEVPLDGSEEELLGPDVLPLDRPEFVLVVLVVASADHLEAVVLEH
jgi:hypothetical protein